MQTTLLGLGIALILALVAALVGPIFVDWEGHRANFEAEATRMVGLPVRIGGKIDVRLLPAPSISLRDVEVGSRAAPVFGAQGARAELSLGSLMRGEWRAAVLTIEAPEISINLDASGKIATHAAAPTVDVERVSIDRIVIENGSLTFEDAANSTRVALSNVSFGGDVRSLAGQIRGEGAFAFAGQTYSYRLSTGRPTESGIRVRFNFDSAERPISYELDGTVVTDQGKLRYEGTVAVARPAGAVLASGKTVANEPWKITAKAKADLHAVLLEQIDVQYGPDERSLRMTGTASLKLGKKPQLDAVLSARQIDLDRTLADSNASKRLPLAALGGLGESLAEIGRVPVPMHLELGIDIVTLSGATVQAVRGDIRSADNAWVIQNFEFRAPGYTQVALSGRIEGPHNALEFSGPVSVESADPRTLLTCFEGFERARSAIGPLHLRGDVRVGKQRVSIDRVQAALEGKTFEGRLAYAFPSGNRPAKLDAALKAAELDIDGMSAFFTTAFAGSSFVRPGEVALAADLGRVVFAGVTAGATRVNLAMDAAGLRIDQFSVADFGGAAIDARGTIDITAMPPKGSIALSVDAQRFDGLAALAQRHSPQLAVILQRHGANLLPAKIDGSLGIDPSAASIGARAVAKLTVDGTLGKFRLTAAGEGVGDLGAPDKVDTKFRAQLSSSDSALLAMFGIDRMLAADKKPVSLTITASGPIGADLRVEFGLASEGFDAGAKGTVRLIGNEPSGTLALTMSAADLRGLRRGAAPLPASLRSNLSLASSPMRLDDLVGQIGNVAIRGKLTLAVEPEWRLDGKVTASLVDVPAVLAAAIGAEMPAGLPWSARPLDGMPFSDIRGKIQIEAPQGLLNPTLSVDGLKGVISMTPSTISFIDMSGNLAGGVVTASSDFRKTPSGMAVSGKVTISNGDASKLIRNSTQTPISGRVSSQIEFESAGSSPAALIGALRGHGTITLENAQIAALDPKAIDSAIRVAERGTPIAASRIADMVTQLMEAGVMNVSWASAPIEISAGRARLGTLVMPAHTEDLAVGASIDLVEETLDARFTLFGQRAGHGPIQRPELSVAVKGPISAPRRSVDASVLVGWLTLQAVDREAKKLAAEEREVERRERLNATIRERAEKLPALPPSTPPVAENRPLGGPAQPHAAPPTRMPPPPKADRQPPRASVIETTPLFAPR